MTLPSRGHTERRMGTFCLELQAIGKNATLFQVMPPCSRAQRTGPRWGFYSGSCSMSAVEKPVPLQTVPGASPFTPPTQSPTLSPQEAAQCGCVLGGSWLHRPQKGKAATKTSVRTAHCDYHRGR
jgi:hypothetical protein